MNTSVSRKTKVCLRPSPWDILVAALVLALAAALALFFLSRAAGSTEGDLVCTVSQNGRILEEITLTAGSPDQEKRGNQPRPHPHQKRSLRGAGLCAHRLDSPQRAERRVPARPFRSNAFQPCASRSPIRYRGKVRQTA